VAAASADGVVRSAIPIQNPKSKIGRVSTACDYVVVQLGYSDISF